MRNIAPLIIVLITISSHAQHITSSHLDSLIWAEINLYRSGLKIAPVKKFNTGDLRKRSYQVTTKNAHRDVADFDHTRGDSVFVGYNAECIYSMLLKGAKANAYAPEHLNETRLKELAKIVVHAWITSSDHNYLIRSSMVAESTITSIIESTSNYFRLIVSYHDLVKI